MVPGSDATARRISHLSAEIQQLLNPYVHGVPVVRPEVPVDLRGVRRAVAKFWWIGQPVVPAAVHGALPGLAEVVEAVGVVAAAECSLQVDRRGDASHS